jgi:hypothetical protein
VGWAEQPVLVNGIKLNTLPVLKNFWSTHQGDIVIVNDIKTFSQNFLDAGGFEKRKTSLLSCQRREKAKPALKTMHGHIRVVLKGTYRIL